MLALFLGAGFSKWAASLPVAKELFDFAIKPWGSEEKQKLERVKSLKHEWDLVYPDGLSEQFIETALKFHESHRQVVLWYLTRRLSTPFIWKEYHAKRWRRHALMIDETRKFNIPGIVKAKEFLQQFYDPSLVGIITTNYDLLIEYALGTKGFNYGIPNQILTGRGAYPVSQWKNPVKLRGRVPVAKIHGSVSWDEQAYYTDGRRGLTGNALIVAPTPDKQPPAVLKSVWELAERILKDSTTLIIFGFAFNPFDEAVLKLLKVAGAGIQSILIIDINPKIERSRQLWPKSKIIACQPPPKKVTISKWFKECYNS